MNTSPTVDIGYVTPTQREEFEIWAKSHGLNLHSRLSGIYVFSNTQCAWLGWQAGVAQFSLAQQEYK